MPGPVGPGPMNFFKPANNKPKSPPANFQELSKDWAINQGAQVGSSLAHYGIDPTTGTPNDEGGLTFTIPSGPFQGQTVTIRNDGQIVEIDTPENNIRVIPALAGDDRSKTIFHPKHHK